MSNLTLGPIESGDLPFVRAMLYEAAFWRGTLAAQPRDEALRQAQAHLDGVDRVSLSVETDNPAMSLYGNLGFVPAGALGNAVTMTRPVL